VLSAACARRRTRAAAPKLAGPSAVDAVPSSTNIAGRGNPSCSIAGKRGGI
jgi:hypothetical protein